MAVERDNDGDALCAYFGDSLDEVAKDIESSDTGGVEVTRVYDLDEDTYQLPIMTITGWSQPIKERF